MSPFSSFTSYKIWHTWFCLVQEQVTRGVSSMWKKLQAEGNDICNVLPALHAFTGCDKNTRLYEEGWNNSLTHITGILDVFCPLEDLLTCHITRGAFCVHTIQFNHYDMNVLRHAKLAERFTPRPGSWYQPSTTMQKCIKHARRANHQPLIPPLIWYQVDKETQLSSTRYTWLGS